MIVLIHCFTSSFKLFWKLTVDTSTVPNLKHLGIWMLSFHEWMLSFHERMLSIHKWMLSFHESPELISFSGDLFF